VQDAGTCEEAKHSFQVAVIAASAGGIAALTAVISALPSDFALPIAIVQHLDPRHESLVARILARHALIQVREARHGDLLQPAVAYVAPSGFHMTLNGQCIVISDAAKPVHFVRPSADLLFESAAATCSPVIAVILSGSGVDGAAGAVAVKHGGGCVIVQDEASAEFSGMPHAAIATGVVDQVLPLGAIAGALVDLTRNSC
jgi:two-component system chemotaxis response regulator CheB